MTNSASVPENDISPTDRSEGSVAVHFPVEIVFRHMPRSVAVANAVLRQAAKLQRLNDRISKCHVAIDATGSHHKGNTYQVGIRLIVPGHDVLAAHSSDRNRSHEDLYVAIRDVFADIQGQTKRLFVKKNRPRP